MPTYTWRNPCHLLFHLSEYIGTNNRFDATAVLFQWKQMISECKLRYIQIISFSGDGDTQLLKSMSLSSKFYSYSTKSIPTKFENVFSEESMKNIPLKWIKSIWFAVERVTRISPVQDTVHLRVKLKARLMTHSQILALDKFLLSLPINTLIFFLQRATQFKGKRS